MSEKVDEKIVDSLRQKFLLECRENPSYYDSIDVNRVRADDWQIERFVMNTNSEDEALLALIRAMRWKKEYGVHERDAQYFPRELHEWFSACEEFGRDSHNRIIVWSSAKLAMKIPEVRDLLEQFFVFQTELIDRKACRDGWIQVSDCGGIGLAHIDLDANRFFSEIHHCYYPRGLRLNIVVDMPFILNSVARLGMAFMNHEMRSMCKLINRKNLVAYVDSDLIPVSLGGKRETVEKRKCPEGVRPITQSTHLRLTDKQIKAFLNAYNNVIKK